MAAKNPLLKVSGSGQGKAVVYRQGLEKGDT